MQTLPLLLCIRLCQIHYVTSLHLRRSCLTGRRVGRLLWLFVRFTSLGLVFALAGRAGRAGRAVLVLLMGRVVCKCVPHGLEEALVLVGLGVIRVSCGGGRSKTMNQNSFLGMQHPILPG